MPVGARVRSSMKSPFEEAGMVPFRSCEAGVVTCGKCGSSWPHTKPDLECNCPHPRIPISQRVRVT